MWSPNQDGLRSRYGRRPGFQRAWDRALAWCNQRGIQNHAKFAEKFLRELEYEERRARALGKKIEILGEFMPEQMDLKYYTRIVDERRLKISELAGFKIVVIRKMGKIELKVRPNGQRRSSRDS